MTVISYILIGLLFTLLFLIGYNIGFRRGHRKGADDNMEEALKWWAREERRDLERKAKNN